MEEALDELIDSGRADGYGQRIMILLTDGNANRWNGRGYSEGNNSYDFLGKTVHTRIHPTVGGAMEDQTRRARANNVRIYCVTFGNSVDTEVHREIARNTQGAYYYAANHEDLTAVFVDIFRRLPPLITM
jgi:Mg-chelatase subunit ChlD